MQVHELKCFGARPGYGNTAFVVEDDGLDVAGRIAFAAKRNSTCVFIDPCDDRRAAFALDYFYPHMRSPLCLHATLGAAQVLLARRQGGAPITVRTTMRGQYLTLSREAGGLFIGLARQAPPQVDLEPGLVAALLAAPGIALASIPQVASVGSPKLLIEVKDRAALAALRPDLELVARWGKANGVSGCYAWCRLGGDNYEGRNFNHLAPALEDSATGVAAGALSALLGHAITLFQGAATGQACVISTRVNGDTILVGGAAELQKPVQTGDRPRFPINRGQTPIYAHVGMPERACIMRDHLRAGAVLGGATTESAALHS